MTAATVQEIEKAIDQLSPAEREELYVRLDARRSQSIDTRIEAGLVAGYFDALISEAIDDHRHGRTRPL